MREIKFRVLIDNKIYYQDKYEGYGEYYEQVKYTGKIEYCVSEFRIQPLNLKLSDESIVEIKVIGNIYENKNLLEENR